MRRGLAAFAVVFLAAHLQWLPPTLEDIDSFNFAMGVRDFDVARHQPHPPGYPVFIALGKLATPVLRGMGVAAAEVRGLALWSALSGAAAVLLLFAFVRALDESDWRAWWVTVAVALSPLFWFTALRPLSDMTGLCAALAAQALLLAVITGRGAPWMLVAGGFAAGLAIGVRSQMFLLTVPLLAVAVARPATSIHVRGRLAALAAAAAGVLVWAIPLVAVSGGPGAYLAALGSQAGEDFSGVVLLWTTRTARVAADAAIASLLWPWGHPVVGAVVVSAAVAGVARLAWRAPWRLALLLVAALPYAVFHLLFHEAVTVRYALPLVLPIAYLAVYALDGLGRVPTVVGVGVLATVSMVLAIPASAAYGREGSPTVRLLQEIVMRPGGERAPDAVGMHAVARRAAEWTASGLPGRLLIGSQGREWLTLIEEWRAHPDSVIAFAADPRRTDLILFDQTTRVLRRQYRWGFVEPPFVGGARPGNADYFRLAPPGWMLDRGWSLTAEVAGITAADGWGPHKRASVAWIRQRSEEATLLIGGRHLGPGADPAGRVTITVQGQPLQTFDVTPGFFLRTIPIPAGALQSASAYVPLEVRTAGAAAGAPPPMALEQFDLQSQPAPMLGLDAGWQEPEYDPRSARSWRWTSERSILWVRPVGRDVTLTLTGESPLRYFDSAPTVTVTVGGHVARFSPEADFSEEVRLPAAALASANGRVTLESDRWFVPRDRGISPDPRHLALRIYSVGVK